MQINPYLNFDGTCAEAMRFYQKALGGKLDVMPFAGTPMEKDIPSQYRERVMHACLTTAEGQSLMASDAGPWAPYEAPKGMQVTLNYDTAAEGRKAFDATVAGRAGANAARQDLLGGSVRHVHRSVRHPVDGQRRAD